jgi:hypothetical protein|tara:strand:+ start:2990 stop:3268 length:279 start_codon:yes stop_codon:yes gene_type:complete
MDKQIDKQIDKKLNSAKISLTYLNNYNHDIIEKIKNLEEEKFLINTKCKNNDDKLKILLEREEKIIQEINKGQELQKILKNNNKILSKLYNL